MKWKKLENPQAWAIVFSIILAALGVGLAAWGAAQEAASNSPGSGIVLIVVGTIALGFAGLSVSVAAKLSGKD